MSFSSRRSFLGSAGLAAAVCVTKPLFGLAVNPPSPFKIAVINNEISEDFDHACSVAANDFGMQWMELREMWKKNICDLSDAQLAEAEKILAKYKLRVTDIASPLFKVDWPGAPRSKFSPKRDAFNADFDYKQQEEVLQRCIALCKRFKTDKIRCFDFWRIDDVTPYRKDINDRLRQAAEICGKQGLLLVIENEPACNTATGREAVKTLAAVPSPHFALNWDPANAVEHGELDAFPQPGRCCPSNASITATSRMQSRTSPATQVVASGQGHHRLDGAVQGASEGRLSRGCQPRDPLDGRRHTRSIHPHQLGGHEAGSPKRRNPIVFVASGCSPECGSRHPQRHISMNASRISSVVNVTEVMRVFPSRVTETCIYSIKLELRRESHRRHNWRTVALWPLPSLPELQDSLVPA